MSKTKNQAEVLTEANEGHEAGTRNRQQMAKLAPEQREQLGLCATNIINCYQLSKNLGAQSAIVAAKLGAWAIMAKELVGHSHFGKWRASYCPTVSLRTVQRQMGVAEEFAKRLGGKNDTVSHLAAMELPDPRQLTDKSNDKMALAVSRIADGRSITQLYEDFGICKARKKKGSEIEARRKAPITSKENDEVLCQLAYEKADEALMYWMQVGAPKANPEQLKGFLKLAIEAVEQATKRKVVLQ